MNKTLEVDLLRALVAIAEEGSFARAADRLHRTQAAISLQMQRLETVAGVPLFKREGRRRLLGPQGETLLVHARRVLAAHDQAVMTLEQNTMAGNLRIGASQGLADSALPKLLGEFGREHPDIQLNVRIAPSSQLITAFQNGELDIALTVSFDTNNASGQFISSLPVEWVVPDAWSNELNGQIKGGLPIAAFAGECGYREVALKSLDRAGIPWRMAFSSDSLHAILDAVKAGIGVTARTQAALSNGLRAGHLSDALPPLQPVQLYLHTDQQSLLASRLSERIKAWNLKPR